MLQDVICLSATCSVVNDAHIRQNIYLYILYSTKKTNKEESSLKNGCSYLKLANVLKKKTSPLLTKCSRTQLIEPHQAKSYTQYVQ